MKSTKKSVNPFQHNAEEVLQARMKHARRVPREEFFKGTEPKSDVKKVIKK